MRPYAVCALLLGAALPAAVPAAHAANLPPLTARVGNVVVTVGARRPPRPQRDCTPYNGPYGFYGNIWCQPPSDASYLRNLGAPWPMETPPNLRTAKPHVTGSDW